MQSTAPTMADYISQLLKEDIVLLDLQTLGFPRDEFLLKALDDFLKRYVTANEVCGTEPSSIDPDEEAVADIVTAWLDGEVRGKCLWPCDESGRPRYDDGDHEL